MLKIERGDSVRVIDLDSFQVAFAKRVANRDAIVESIYTPADWGKCNERVRVRFLKRGNRGKEFIENMRVSDLELVRKGDKELDDADK